ncbi:TolC family protein [Psychroflexus montanilacus]|uniref:TolC family protein n=1 Tax=Psychroflexus montanilacus TaxID=2873598 RepID=UPI001CCD357A|nr:TolC family protein [Psychroflexus montanilacus]MBZ9652730.1 TolC family protein [Psychroflexus montanilacus]
MKSIFTVIAVLICGSQLFAQDKNVPSKWTLEACVTYAMDNNISIKQSRLNQENADISKSEAIGNYLPNLNGSASNTWNSGLTQNITTGILENQVVRNLSVNATAGITLFDGLRNLRTFQRAKLEQLSSQYSLQLMKDDIALFVANAYLEILVNKQQLAVLVEQNNVTQEQIELTRKTVKVGNAPEGDLLEIEATNADEEQQIIVAENNLRISKISLAQTLLIEDYQSFDIADEEYDVPLTDILSNSPEEIIAKAKQERYDVKVAEQQLEIAEKDIEIARSQLYPTLDGFVNYNTRESDRGRTVGGGVDPDEPTQEIGVVEATGQAVVAPNIRVETAGPSSFFSQLSRNDGFTYGAQLNIPIFNGFATRNQIKRAEVAAKRAEFELDQAELDLESNVYQAYVDAQGSAKAYEAALKSVESQKLAFEYAQQRFDVGVSNAFELSQSKFRLTNAENRLINAKYDYIFNLKVLELFFGIRVVDY